MFSYHVQAGIRAALAATALAMPGAVAASAQRSAAPQWLVVDAARHSATITVVAGYSSANDGLNFNGDANGKMTISVPSGYRVTLAYKSKGSFPHNVVITTAKPTATSDTFPLAFPGSGPADTTVGVSSARYSFRATKAGTYYLVCGLPGHAATGMWAWFKVTLRGRASVKI